MEDAIDKHRQEITDLRAKLNTMRDEQMLILRYFDLIIVDSSDDLRIIDVLGPVEEMFPEARVEIYNRWGNRVYEKEGYGNVTRWGSDAWWDGRSNKGVTVGKDRLPAATYFYILYFNDGETEPKAGSIFLNK